MYLNLFRTQRFHPSPLPAIGRGEGYYYVYDVRKASSNRVVSGRNPALELPISFIIS